jgi:hypothetical protein
MDFESVYKEFTPTLTKISESYYNMEPSAIIKLEVIIINLDMFKPKKYNSKILIGQRRSFHTSIPNFRNDIKPLNNRKVNSKPFASMDIETMNINGVQQPVLISLTWSEVNTHTFLLNPSLPIEIGINNLWSEFFNFIESDLPKSIKTIFVHNL